MQMPKGTSHGVMKLKIKERATKELMTKMFTDYSAEYVIQ